MTMMAKPTIAPTAMPAITPEETVAVDPEPLFGADDTDGVGVQLSGVETTGTPPATRHDVSLDAETGIVKRVTPPGRFRESVAANAIVLPTLTLVRQAQVNFGVTSHKPTVNVCTGPFGTITYQKNRTY